VVECGEKRRIDVLAVAKEPAQRKKADPGQQHPASMWIRWGNANEGTPEFGE
jgi:hypothetical protein